MVGRPAVHTFTCLTAIMTLLGMAVAGEGTRAALGESLHHHPSTSLQGANLTHPCIVLLAGAFTIKLNS